MPDLKELIVKKLKDDDADNETIALSEEIFQWYDEGGADLVKSNIDQKVKMLKSKFNKEMKEIKGITPKLKKRKKRR